MGKGRAGLITSVMIGLLAITTAGVSTYAWFQANANVTITAAPTSTTITVTKPDDYMFYAYKGNKASHTYTGTFSSDFDAITTSELLADKTNLSAMYPGKVMVFAVKMTGCDSNIDLKIKRITSNTHSDQVSGQVRRAVDYSNRDINIGWAMDIYTSAVATSSENGAYNAMVNNPASLSAQDQFNFTVGTLKSSFLPGTPDGNIITLSTQKTIFTGAAPNASSTLFYAVYFTNASSTWFKETNSGGTEDYYSPQADTAAGRYFHHYSSGDNNDKLYNSNCYAGLQFQLNELTLEF